ncbi:EcsC family protein [Rhodococcus sp. X156]|uniref:EcsC family protein n=1 Tax=Rhodococcus sp. X156 TaxID=2499145 RepID=UPI0013E381C5|nr:EcsC family protein [Rhodococcus sp. X156]
MTSPMAPASTGMVVINKVISIGIDGIGPLSSAREIAEESLAHHGEVEKAIDRLIATHMRLVGATGFATGVGGAFTMPVTIPADITLLYAYAARCSAGIAHLRGYDVTSEEVRSAVLLSLLGSAGSAVLADIGINVANKTAMAALNKLPGTILIEINKKVGYRLFTKFGTKGAINLVKWIPLAGGGVGSAVNVATMRSIGRYSKSTFTPVSSPSAGLV